MNQFHFLRPLWLLAMVPAALLVWRLWRSADDSHAWRGIISDELLPQLMVGKQTSHRVPPVSLLGAAWILSTLALAGPTWHKEPAPFSDDSAALVVVLKVAPSMLTEDVQPNRLARSVQKLRDLLKLRPGAKTALVAYAGSAHRVLPPTTDADVVNSFAAELGPEIFPREGDAAAAALTMATDILHKSGQRGWLLWIADSVAPEQQAAITKAAPHLAPISLLASETAGAEFETLQQTARAIGCDLVSLTPDDADVKHLLRRTVFSNVPDASGGERWHDAGYALVPLVTLLTLAWFRRGWVVRGTLWGAAT